MRRTISAQNRAQNDAFEPRRAQRSRRADAVHPSSVGRQNDRSAHEADPTWVGIAATLSEIDQLAPRCDTIGGIGSGYAFTLWFTMVQRLTEDVHCSRVFAVAEACEQGVFIAGMLGSWVVNAVGPRPTYPVPGALLALGAAVAARVWRSAPLRLPQAAARSPGAATAEPAATVLITEDRPSGQEAHHARKRQLKS